MVKFLALMFTEMYVRIVFMITGLLNGLIWYVATASIRECQLDQLAFCRLALFLISRSNFVKLSGSSMPLKPTLTPLSNQHIAPQNEEKRAFVSRKGG